MGKLVKEQLDVKSMAMFMLIGFLLLYYAFQDHEANAYFSSHPHAKAQVTAMTRISRGKKSFDVLNLIYNMPHTGLHCETTLWLDHDSHIFAGDVIEVAPRDDACDDPVLPASKEIALWTASLFMIFVGLTMIATILVVLNDTAHGSKPETMPPPGASP